MKGSKTGTTASDSGCLMLGVDAGGGFIKLVVLQWCGQQYHIVAVLARPVGSSASDTLRDMVELLSTAHGRLLPAQSVAIALPAHELVFRVLPVPQGLKPQQIDLMVRMEAEQTFVSAPVPSSLPSRPASSSHAFSAHTFSDYRYIGTACLHMTACSHESMYRSVQLLEDAGLAAQQIGVDAELISVACFSSNAVRPHSEHALLVDVGATGIRLYVCAVSPSESGGSTSPGSNCLGLPGYCRHYALSPQVDSPDSAACVFLLRRAIQQYQMSDMLSQPSSVYLYGGGANIDGLQDVLNQAFAIPVHKVNPFSDWLGCPLSEAESGLNSCQLIQSAGLPPEAFALSCALAMQCAPHLRVPCV